MVGNHDVDRLFVRESIASWPSRSKPRDLAAEDEALSGVPTPQASDRPRFDPDPNRGPSWILYLRGPLAQSLRLATTASFAGTPEVHETILASDMASLVRLDAAGLGIQVLAGLEPATSLRSLSLGGNSIWDFSTPRAAACRERRRGRPAKS